MCSLHGWLMAASWASSWGSYIRGNVVSEHACRIITNFLTATMARTAADGDSSEDEADDPHDDDVPPLCPSAEDVTALLNASYASEVGIISKNERERNQALQRSRCVWRRPGGPE